MAGRRESRKSRDQDIAALRDSQMFAQFGMMPTPAQAGLQTAMLPQIMQMKQMELMQRLAKDTREAYLQRFAKYYQFDDIELQEFERDFNKVKTIIQDMIPPGDENKAVRDMYDQFLSSYPEMYLSMIPREVLQAKLSEKCQKQNTILRESIPAISERIVEIMRELARLQEELGVSPLVSTVMGDMPDPIALMTNPQYAPYKNAMAVFQAMRKHAESNNGMETVRDPDTNAIIRHGFREYALKYMEEHTRSVGPPYNPAFDEDQVKDAIKLLSGTSMGSACAPFGPEYNQKGPKPNKNAAACLASGSNDAWSTGNPNDPKGSKQIYRAQRLPDGSIDWVLSGDMAPVVAGFPGMPVPANFNASQYGMAMQGMPGMAGPGGFYQPQPKARKSSKKTKSSSKAKKSKK